MQVAYRENYRRGDGNSALNTYPTLPTLTPSNPDSVIDKRGLLFKPMPLARQPMPLSRMPGLLTIPSIESSEDEWEIWSRLTLPLEAVAQKRQPWVSFVSADALPQVLGHHLDAVSVTTQEKLNMLTLARPATKQLKSGLDSMRELLIGLLGAGAVVTAYMITPMVTTLIPVLPDDWSRLLMALEILGIGEFIICRILMKTTQQEHYISS